jgi:hypothetical protein
MINKCYLSGNRKQCHLLYVIDIYAMFIGIEIKKVFSFNKRYVTIEYSQVEAQFCSFSNSMILAQNHSLTNNTKHLSSRSFKLHNIFAIQAVADTTIGGPPAGSWAWG